MRILVVEDEVDLVHTLHTGLTAEGYGVELAHACAQLRREGDATPILVLTARDGDRDPNLVEAWVSALRKKVDAAFHRQSLRTVRGIGYRLVDDRERD
ncbi:winged helix-turn-helix domain-containing protein [Streptomyces sp. NPDC127033]|uniref:winged helix-turn-helix domain-containing protein n=1 Tax=Streptomyces sp. NPDC127033 TaxID=3347110 RepID=UPI0036657C4F